MITRVISLQKQYTTILPANWGSLYSPGITLKFASYYADAGIYVCVKIFIGLNDSAPRISDAIPFEEVMELFKYISR